MILLDSRVGSKHYETMLGSLAVLTTLDSADAAFSSADGRTVGVEIKKLADAVACLFSGRLADHQIPLMRAQYDYCYIIVEGTWRTDPTSGVLQYWKEYPSKKDTVCGRWKDSTTGSRRLMAASFERWLTSLELLGGMRLRYSSSPRDTGALLVSLYSWFQRESHRTMHVMHETMGTEAELTRPALLRRILAMLPGVGWERSAILARRFKSVRAMVDASLDDWYIEGQIAEHSATKIVRALNGE